MATPLTILLADDQVPWDTAVENERTKAEIRREFAVAKPEVDVDAAFADDYAWFTGLLAYLEHTKGETVIRARTFEEAKQRIDNPRGLDVAIVDLSWWGDYTFRKEPHIATIVDSSFLRRQGTEVVPRSPSSPYRRISAMTSS
jgi:hypothetical protein